MPWKHGGGKTQSAKGELKRSDIEVLTLEAKRFPGEERQDFQNEEDRGISRSEQFVCLRREC